jgi:hypothetical protein
MPVRGGQNSNLFVAMPRTTDADGATAGPRRDDRNLIAPHRRMLASQTFDCAFATHTHPSGFSRAVRRSATAFSRFASTKQPLVISGSGHGGLSPVWPWQTASDSERTLLGAEAAVVDRIGARLVTGRSLASP